MRIKNGYVLRDIVDTKVVVPAGERVIDFKGLMTLTGAAPFIWGRLEAGATREELYAAVAEEYDVDPARARKDIDALLARMDELGLLEP